MVQAGDTREALAVVGQRISTDGERTWIPVLYDWPDIREPGGSRSSATRTSCTTRARSASCFTAPVPRAFGSKDECWETNPG